MVWGLFVMLLLSLFQSVCIHAALLCALKTHQVTKLAKGLPEPLGSLQTARLSTCNMKWGVLFVLMKQLIGIELLL